VTCNFCKGETEEELIRYVQEYKGVVVIVENVPADVCQQCGEQFIRPEIADKIQRLVWDAPKPKRTAEVPVYDLADVA